MAPREISDDLRRPKEAPYFPTYQYSLKTHQHIHPKRLQAQVLQSVSGKTGHECEYDQIRHEDNYNIYILN